MHTCRAGETAKGGGAGRRTGEDDFVAYFTTFERFTVAYEVTEERWAFKLAANLSGRALQA